MAESATKQQVLERLREERARWESLLAEASDQRMGEPGPMGEWTMKDSIAHLTNWWRWHVARVAAARRHEPAPEHPPQSEVQVINSWVAVVNRDRPLRDVLRDARDVWSQMETLIEGLPDDEVLRPGHEVGADERGVGSDVVECFVKHLRVEHEADIRRWIERERRRDAA